MIGDIEVAPDGDDWKVQVQGEQLIEKVLLGVYDTKAEATQWGRHYADERHVELFIKKKDGTIGDRDSHGNDPRTIPG
jgi:hypothetical protein